MRLLAGVLLLGVETTLLWWSDRYADLAVLLARLSALAGRWALAVLPARACRRWWRGAEQMTQSVGFVRLVALGLNLAVWALLIWLAWRWVR